MNYTHLAVLPGRQAEPNKFHLATQCCDRVEAVPVARHNGSMGSSSLACWCWLNQSLRLANQSSHHSFAWRNLRFKVSDLENDR